MLLDASVVLNEIPIPPEMMILNSVTVVADSYTLSGDAWIFPYLNLHAHGGTFTSTAKDIDASVIGMTLPLPEAINFSGTSYGLGGTLCGAYKTIFFSYDWNINWSNTELVNGATGTIMQGPRVGVVFGEPDTQKVVYVGAVHERFLGNQDGSIFLEGVGQLDYVLTTAPEASWNYVVGIKVNFSKKCNVGLEQGFGKRKHTMFYLGRRY